MFGGPKYKIHKMKRALMNRKIESIKLPCDFGGVSLIALPNGNFVYGTEYKVFLLNENFQELESVYTGGYNFCALSHRNEIYVSVQSINCTCRHFIILFDLNLNELKRFGSFGTRYNQLNYPLCLCCHGDYLYICIYNNKLL